ncbi:MAG: efflux RND transporter periplasmic adaptor subunit [Rhodocyclaceae bacterium]|nr:efflux RND transporter periplasmic adaptor subunit [Rhodocyclaceae bacterium]MCA3076662.1 efflux RND transporter periplasmic adaptor subunit [Rhodocyclaceae bacterium]MCA3091150.1 efflux RND transporter periplasmic adaptor subunit [Rhodocyclaceae bacterium]MCA3092312.1 efflux RND transporter periplasmic adaptor subunit [Rhodocyclaceae bacterium]MCA3098485.1 efflux RND transporter periplasmic adaptor subunit [Rhodocyclaceae bacterium]
MPEQRHHDLAIHPIEDTDPADLMQRRAVVRRGKWLAFIVVLLLAVGAGRAVVIRNTNASALEASIADLSKVYVRVTQPKTSDAGQTVTLPGTLQGYTQSPIGARASGYVKRWHRDIGSRVKAGDLLAEIDTPEIDQQLIQALAAREQTAASLALATSSLERWEALRRKDAVSQQELDERRSNEVQARANLAAADANIVRLRQLESFKRVVAPFSGVITRRSVDVGDLIDAGGGAARALFVLTQTETLRAFISVPQSYAHLVRAGQEVKVTQIELQGRVFAGKVVRTSSAIDPATRTMQVEVNLPNPDGALMPGAFIQVALPLKASQATTVETNTLMFRAEGVRVAVVGADGVVKLRPVRIGRNFGPTVEILEGITTGDRVVMNPSDSIGEGDKVTIVTVPPGGRDGAKGAAGKGAPDKATGKDAEKAAGKGTAQGQPKS